MSKWQQKWQQRLPLSCLLWEGASEAAARYLARGAASAPGVPILLPYCADAKANKLFSLHQTVLVATAVSLHHWAARGGRAWMGFSKAGKVFAPS